MADIEYGNLNLVQLKSWVPFWANRLNTSDYTLMSVGAEASYYVDLSGDADYTLNREEVESGSLDFAGAITADRVVDFDPTYESRWMLRDRTTGGQLTFKPTGETGVILPKETWILVSRTESGIELMQGWAEVDDAPAVSYGTNWGDTSGRAVEIHKSDAHNDIAGGFVQFQGACEKSAAPAINDTILTVPQYYRPRIPVSFVVPVNSDLTAEAGNYGPLTYVAGAETLSADGFMKFAGDTLPNTTLVNGHTFHRAGAVVGLSVQLEVTAETTPGTIDVIVQVNNVDTLTATITTSGTGFYGFVATAVPSVHTFAAGDSVKVFVDFNTFVGTAEHIMTRFEVTNDAPLRETVVEISTAGAMSLRGDVPASGETIDLSQIRYLVEN